MTMPPWVILINVKIILIKELFENLPVPILVRLQKDIALFILYCRYRN